MREEKRKCNRPKCGKTSPWRKKNSLLTVGCNGKKKEKRREPKPKRWKIICPRRVKREKSNHKGELSVARVGKQPWADGGVTKESEGYPKPFIATLAEEERL